MIASDANTQDPMPESSIIETPTNNTTETQRIGVTHWDRIKLYKKLLTSQQHIVFVSKCLHKGILLNSNKRHNTPVDLCLIVQKRRHDKEVQDYEKMKRQHLKYWKSFNDRTRQNLRNFKHKLKANLKEKYSKLLLKAPKSNSTKNQKSKRRWKLRKKTQMLEQMRQQASKVIVNTTDLTLDDADKQLLLLGLSFIPTPKSSTSELENEWTELNQHIRRVEWDNVFSDKNTNIDEDSHIGDIIDEEEGERIPSKLQFVKHNRPASDQIDEETKAYTELCTPQLKNLKPKLRN